MTKRLFLAMDDDNTGAMEATEFLHGLRMMCDESGGEAWKEQRVQFAFNLFDLDREKTVDQSEIKSFLKTFYTEAINMVHGWIGQFEDLFGADVAVTGKGGTTGKIRWKDDPSLQRSLKALEDRMERERELMSEAALNFRQSKEENGIRLKGFENWCNTQNETIRLRILDWLKMLGNQWLQRMALSQAEREQQSVPVARNPKGFKVAKTPGLSAKYSRITQEQVDKVFDHFANHGQMSTQEFYRCMDHLGVCNPHLRERLFAVFDDSASLFIEPREFRAGIEQLMVDDRDKKLLLAFKLFDSDGNGFINEDEMRRFLSLFFLVADESAQAVIHTFETLFGADKSISKHIDDAVKKLQHYYIDVIVTNAFKATKDAAPGPAGQKRLYITEFKLWSFANGDRVKDWLDSMASFWISKMTKIVKDLESDSTTEEIQIGAESESIKALITSMSNPQSAAVRKAKLIKQPGYFSGAPQIPPPNCTFSRAKVKFIQELFTKLGGADGVMGPPEWKRCMRQAGVLNEDVATRLFDMFDASGDKEMNAKEFTWGLSDICSDEPPVGMTMTKDEVRRAFAYRFYDSNLGGYFEKDECKAFLLSWKTSSENCIRSANDVFMQVYGLDKNDLDIVPNPQIEKEQHRLKGVEDAIENELSRFTDQIFSIFTGSLAVTKMNYEAFTAFARAAPIVVDWLTELGKFLDQQFPKMAGMTFEEKKFKVDPKATELSRDRMLQYFMAASNLGVMNEDGFEKCLASLGVQNKQFAKLLFRVVDINKNGSLTQDEFIDSFTTLISGTPEQKLKIAFQLHDVQGKGYLERRSLRMFFVSFFGAALDEVNILANSLDEWLNGRIKDSERGLRNAEREKGLPQYYFVGSARKNNLELAVNLRKKAAGEVSLLVDQMVEHALRYASQSDDHLYAHEFNQWMTANTTFVTWMENLGAKWMVTPEQKQQESAAQAAKHFGATGARNGSGGTMPSRGPSGDDPMRAVVKPTDVGKTVGSVVKSAGSGAQPYLGMAPKSALSTGPGGTWWARTFSNRSHVERTQVRPRTHFDYITLGDVDAVFSKEVASQKTYDKGQFRSVLREGLRFDNPLVMDKLYTMFDVNGDGKLDAEEVATGLVLMVRGSRHDRLKLAFSFFDAGGDGVMMKHEMRVFLRAFSRVSSEVMNGLIDMLTEVFGPVPVTGTEVMEAQEFKMKLLKAAHKKLETSSDKMVQQAFAQDVNQDNKLSWEEFELWAEYNPQFAMWLQRLGGACLEAIAPLEDRNVSQAGQRPVASTYRLRRKFPLGTQFDRLRVHQVRNIFMSYSTYGKLGPEQFASCMNELHVHSPYTVRRLFTLFDRDVSGDVMMREFATGFFLLCAGSFHEKLAEAFNLFDLDGNGFLHGVELDMLLDSFYAIAMDVVCSALSITTDILQPDAQFDHMVMTMSHDRIKTYIRKVTRQLEQFCSRDNGKYYFKEFYRWAEQNGDFIRWLDSLKNMWLESIIEYEAAPGAGPAGAASAGPGRPARTTTAFPPPSAAPTHGPQGVYGYRYTVKKVFTLGVRREQRHTKRLGYQNPYNDYLRLSVHTDQPMLLTLPKLTYVIAPQQRDNIQLQFEPKPRERADSTVQIRLWIHNETTDQNEEYAPHFLSLLINGDCSFACLILTMVFGLVAGASSLT